MVNGLPKTFNDVFTILVDFPMAEGWIISIFPEIHFHSQDAILLAKPTNIYIDNIKDGSSFSEEITFIRGDFF